MRSGTLSISDAPIPQYAPPYPGGVSYFTDATILTITYLTSVESIQHLVPDVLELEEKPLVTAMILDHGMTSFGPYKEYVHAVQVKYNGEVFDFFLSLILDSDSPIMCGREMYGFPKRLGNVSLSNRSAICRGYAERPVGQRVVSMNFMPRERLDDALELKIPGLNLRVIPSVVEGQAASVKELVPVDIWIKGREGWMGSGSICFPEPSRFDPMHEIEVLEYGLCTLVRGASLDLHPPSKVFNLGGC